MKRALGLIFIIVACLAGVLSMRGAMPFMPIFGSSMEPTLQSGNLLFIDPVDIGKIKVGDIIVYNVPSAIRDYYNYPPVVAHRVIKVNTDRGLTFRTKGDNTGEDPFAVRTGDIRGTVGTQVPYAGLPLLFLQSQQGLMFVIISLVLLALFLYTDEISQGRRKLHRVVFSPVIEETNRNNQMLTEKISSTEKKMDSTTQALEKFAGAVALYAQHLASHTSAIQGLSEASHELKRSAAEQNKVIVRLLEMTGQPGQRNENIISKIMAAAPRTQEVMPPPPTFRSEEITSRIAATPQPPKVTPPPEIKEVQSPPGCAIARKALAKRLLEASRRN